MNKQVLVAVLYAVFIFIGGYLGYSSANSLPSLIMGTIFAVALGVCAWSMFLGFPYADYVCLGLTVFLFLFFTYRFLITIKFFPSGFLAIVSLAALVYFILGRK